MALGLDFSSVRSTLGHRNFAVFTAGNSISLIGNWVQRVAVGWLTWELTHSATWLGAVAMAEFLPAIFFAPLIGVMADRLDRRLIAVVGQIFATLQAVALAAFTISGHITPLLIFVLQLLGGATQPLMQTARLVLVPSLVPRENLGNAIAVTSLMFNLARIVGPALAGVLIATVGAGFAFAFNALTYVFVIAALLSLRLAPHQPPARAQTPLLRGIWADFAEGWTYTFGHPVLKWVIPLIMIAAMLTWPVGDLLAGIVDHEFGRGVGALAIFTSAHGLGAVFGGLFLVQRKDGPGLQKIFMGAILLNGLFIAAFAVTPNFWIAAALFSLNGLTLLVGGTTSQTLTQTNAVEHMRGRTLSIWYTLTRTGPAVGAIGLGTLANLYGFGAPVFAAGLITAAAAILIWRGREKTPEA